MAGRQTPAITTRRRVRPLRLASLRALAAAARVIPAALGVLLDVAVPPRPGVV